MWLQKWSKGRWNLMQHKVQACGLSLVLLAGCGGGDPDAMPVAMETFRCSGQGLCLYATGKRSLQGGFRKGEDELKFDAIYRPYHGLSIGDVHPWCVRLVDHKSQQYSAHDNGHCPKSWQRRDGLQRLKGYESHSSAGHRDDLAREMRQLLLKAEAPKGRETALEEIMDMVDTHVIAADDPGHAHVPVQRSKQRETMNLLVSTTLTQGNDNRTQKNSGSGDESENQGYDEYNAWDEESTTEREAPIVGPSSQHVEENGNTEEADEDEWPLDSSTTHQSSTAEDENNAWSAMVPEQTTRLSLFSKGKKDGVPKKSPEEVIEDAGSEFKQTLTLFSKPTKRHLLWGRPTKKHHTATYIEVYSRPLGSKEAWRLVDKTHTANHGSSTKSKQMAAYATCDDTPITYGRTVWKGECAGGWGLGDRKHLCNDDTRLQIRNAYNIASNKRCEKLDHYHRPWCHKR